MNRITINPLWLVPILAALALFALLAFRKHDRESIVDWLGRFGKMFNGWANDVRSTNAKALVTLALYLGTFLVWGICSVYKLGFDETSFGMWLAFLAGLGGFSLAQFKNERATDYGALERQAAIEAAKSSGTVVNATAATVTGAPVKVEASEVKP